jgi:hypothetical protein
MKRRWFMVAGTVMVLAITPLAFLFGASLSGGIGVEIFVYLVMPVLIGILYILGGASVSVGTIEWYQFIGIAEIIMGILVPIWFWLGIPSITSSLSGIIFFMIIGVAGGLYSVFIGADYIRGGSVIDIAACESGPILTLRT